MTHYRPSPMNQHRDRHNLTRLRRGAAALLMTLSSLAAQAGFDWLNYPVFSADLAIAGATVALSGSPEALTVNPAGLGTNGARLQLWAGARTYPAGISQLATAFAWKRGSRIWGGSVRSMVFGRFDGYDEDGLAGEAYTASETALQLGVRQRFGKLLSLGASAGVAAGTLADRSAAALLWSAGMQLELPVVAAQIGLAVQNNGRYLQQYGSEGPADGLPSRWMVGLSKGLAYLPLTFHLAAGQLFSSDDWLWRVGGEFRLGPGLALRWGVDQDKSGYQRGSAEQDLISGISLGLGTLPGDGRWMRTQLDAGVKLLGPLGIATAFALSYRL